MDLWEQRVTDLGLPDGDPVPVTSGVGIQQAAFSHDGRRLVYSQGRAVANLWRIPLLRDREAGWDDAEQLTSEQAFLGGVSVFPGGRRLVFASDRGGNQDLWTMAVPGGHFERLTADPSADQSPSVSRDGRVAFHSYRSGNRDIWIVPAGGGPATQITRDPGVDQGPSWSPDDQALAFTAVREGMADIFVLPLAGGEPRRILEGPLYFPQWSPDGVWLGAAHERQFTRVLASGGPPEVFQKEIGTTFRWSSDGTGIYSLRGGELWSLTLASGAERQLTRLSMRDGGLGGGLAVGPAHLYFTWRSDLGDIWVMDVAGRQR
jgi:TolB protein